MIWWGKQQLTFSVICTLSLKSTSRIKCILGLFILVLSEKCRNLWRSWRSFFPVAKEEILVCLLLRVIILKTRFYFLKISSFPSLIPLYFPESLTIMQMLKGRLYVDKYAESVQYSFLDYLAGGFELNFMVAVDFTGISYISSCASLINYFLGCNKCRN